MKRQRWAAGLVGGVCLALAVLALAWPGGPTLPVTDGSGALGLGLVGLVAQREPAAADLLVGLRTAEEGDDRDHRRDDHDREDHDPEGLLHA